MAWGRPLVQACSWSQLTYVDLVTKSTLGIVSYQSSVARDDVHRSLLAKSEDRKEIHKELLLLNVLMETIYGDRNLTSRTYEISKIRYLTLTQP